MLKAFMEEFNTLQESNNVTSKLVEYLIGSNGRDYSQLPPPGTIAGRFKTKHSFFHFKSKEIGQCLAFSEILAYFCYCYLFKVFFEEDSAPRARNRFIKYIFMCVTNSNLLTNIFLRLS